MLGANTPTKKALRTHIGTRWTLQETSLFGKEFNPNGRNVFVGPDPYNKRTFYGTATYVDGVLVKVE